MMAQSLYSVGTWDEETQAYTPQVGLSKTFNLTLNELRKAIKELRSLGYSAHRRKGPDHDYLDNDTYVLIERTDGKPEA